MTFHTRNDSRKHRSVLARATSEEHHRTDFSNFTCITPRIDAEVLRYHDSVYSFTLCVSSEAQSLFPQAVFKLSC